MLEKGADVDALVGGDARISPLRLAVENNDEEMIKTLLSRRASLSADDGWTPLHYAASSGKTRAAERLLEKGASVNARAHFLEATPLHFAAERGHADIVELLLRRGADASARTWYPLELTSWVEKLTGEVNKRTKRKRTALGLAKMRGHAEVVRILEAHGAKE